MAPWIETSRSGELPHLSCPWTKEPQGAAGQEATTACSHSSTPASPQDAAAGEPHASMASLDSRNQPEGKKSGLHQTSNPLHMAPNSHPEPHGKRLWEMHVFKAPVCRVQEAPRRKAVGSMNKPAHRSATSHSLTGCWQ